MLDIKFIREHPDAVKAGVQKKKVDPSLVDQILAADKERAELIRKTEDLRAKQKRTENRDEATALKKEFKELEAELIPAEEKFTSLLYKLPNVPDEDVPVGADEGANQVLREVGEKQKLSKPRDYLELGETLDLIDTERAAKVSGARFGYLKHEAPLLEFALVQFVFQRLTDQKWLEKVVKDAELDVSAKAFIPLIPPVMIKTEAFRAMGKLDPGQEDERYYLPKDELYLIGSAEHTTGPMHMDETLTEEQLPHRHIAFSTSFRREAGSYGKDTRGILRVHQFDKLEMFSFTHPEKSRDEHELFLAIQEAMMQEIGLPYRAVFVCTGDMVWTDARQYDIETWLPGQDEGAGRYRETHSTSNSTDFQSRRLHTRFKGKDGENHLVHTINGTAFAIGRTIIAILENFQNEDGSVRIPKALQPYMGGLTEIRR